MSNDTAYCVAFKKRRSGRLLWIYTGSTNIIEASRLAQDLVAKRHPNEGYREYGISRA